MGSCLSSMHITINKAEKYHYQPVIVEVSWNRHEKQEIQQWYNACIPGGPCAAHEVEQFVWSDHFVVPVVSTGGAAGGQFGVPLKILEVSSVEYLLQRVTVNLLLHFVFLAAYFL